MSPNRLADEASPYLLQHADNPVDWFPWGDEAFRRARQEDKPILLSIGYAACHWCHVMAHESFEDPDVAAVMNRDFVCVKVDREERPDVDAIYMDALQAMHGHGGWPLTAFLTPEGSPFFTGTYFPPEERHGIPAFPRVLAVISQAWRERRGDAEEQAAQVVAAIGRSAQLSADGVPLDDGALGSAVARLRETADPDHGGFGAAPKFPQPMVHEFLLRAHLRGDADASGLLLRALDRMAAGGLFDQAGGGFHRYSTDARWLVPHFEKMLYDNAQLVRLYTRAWQVFGRERDRRVALATAAWMLDEMAHPEGGFFSSLDADSDGGEGAFYVWSWSEIVAAIGEDAARAFGAGPEGNWEGTNVLTCEDIDADFDDARATLRAARAIRTRPATDDKVLAGWNGLVIGALAEAGTVFGDPALLEAAIRAAEFVTTRLVDDEGRLHRSWRAGRLGPEAVAEDLAVLGDGLLTLAERTGDPRWYRTAIALAEDLLARFEDTERGGFFTTAVDAEPLVIRPKDVQDNAVPSGNSAAAELLLRLFALTGEARYERAATGALALVRPMMGMAPMGFGTALCALSRHLAPPREVAIIGDPDDPATRALLAEATARRFLPDAVIAFASPGDAAELASSIPLFEGRTSQDRPTAFVCERFACQMPVHDAAGLATQLDRLGEGRGSRGAAAGYGCFGAR